MLFRDQHSHLRSLKTSQNGFTANASKAKNIQTAPQALHVKQKELLNRAERKELAKKRLFRTQADRCPSCKTGTMKTVEIIPVARAPPTALLSEKRVKELLLSY